MVLYKYTATWVTHCSYYCMPSYLSSYIPMTELMSELLVSPIGRVDGSGVGSAAAGWVARIICTQGAIVCGNGIIRVHLLILVSLLAWSKIIEEFAV